MKYLIIMLLALSTIGFTAEWNDQSLGMADSTKPVYQLDWGYFPPGNMWMLGSWSPKRMPTPADIQSQIDLEEQQMIQRQQAKDLTSASRWIKLGIITFLIGMVVHAMNSLPILDRLAEYVMAVGCGSVVTGIIFRWMVTHEQEVLYFAIIPLVVAGIASAILSRPVVRKWSISKASKWFKGKDNVTK